MKKRILIAVVAVAIAGAGFGGGFAFAKSSSKGGPQGGQFNRAAGGGAGGGQNRAAGATGFRANMNGGLVTGTVLSADDKSITVSLRDGGSKIVYFSDKTAVLKSTAGAVSDLVKDANVTVVGTAGTDGTITAQSIQLRPAGLDMPFGGGRTRGTTDQQPKP